MTLLFDCRVLCAVSLSYLPGRDLNRLPWLMGYSFCLSAALMLPK
jgi:hypothetical protein